MAQLMSFNEEHTYQIMDKSKIDGMDVELIRTGLYLFLIHVIQQSSSKIIILRQSQLLADVAPHRAHV